MPVELRIPEVGESITEVQIGDWHKREGDAVTQDEIIVEVETDKASVELPAVASGVLSKILKQAGDTAEIGEVIAYIEDAASGDGAAASAKPKGEQAEPRTAAGPSRRAERGPAEAPPQPRKPPQEKTAPARPSRQPAPAPEEEPREPRQPSPKRPAFKAEDQAGAPPEAEAVTPRGADLREEVVRMSPIRRTIAERLVQAQHTAAMLTTFNEVDCSAVLRLREDHQEEFTAKYGVKLGLMSFFVKASIEALKQIPQINAEIRGDSIVYRNYYNIGIAVSTDRGLLVPVLRDADRMSFAGIEQAIREFAQRAKDNRIGLEDLQGGTFTITNGGVFGSLLSTPILNPPQSGILGMHAVLDRPVAVDGQVVIRPMMYVALTYDHRIVDGREAVTFLRRIKEVIETPARMLIEA